MTNHVEILCLETKLFPDRETLTNALNTKCSGKIETMKIDPGTMSDQEWDLVLVKIMQKELTVVL